MTFLVKMGTRVKAVLAAPQRSQRNRASRQIRKTSRQRKTEVRFSSLSSRVLIVGLLPHEPLPGHKYLHLTTGKGSELCSMWNVCISEIKTLYRFCPDIILIVLYQAVSAGFKIVNNKPFAFFAVHHDAEKHHVTRQAPKAVPFLTLMSGQSYSARNTIFSLQQIYDL